MTADNLRHAQYGSDGVQIDDPQKTFATGIAGNTVVFLSADNSSAVNTAAIQAVHDSFPASGGEIIMPAGVFDVNVNTIVFTKPIKLSGQGRGGYQAITGATILRCNSATGDLITALSDACTFRDFGVMNIHPNPTEGAGIKLGSTTVQANAFDLFRVSSRGFYDDVYVLNGIEWTISKCLFYAPVQSGLHIRNYANSDGGDSCVSDCIFVAAIRNAQYGVFWESGSGVKFINNKINWTPNLEEHGKGFYIRPALAASVPPANPGSGEVLGLNSLFLLQNNSIENFTTHGIHIDLLNSGGNASLANVVFQGNEFLPVFARNATAIMIDGPGAFRPSAITISGNILSGCRPLKLENVDGVYIGTNVCKGNPAGKPLIELGTGCNRVKVESQLVHWGTGSNLYTRQMFSDASALGTSTVTKSLRNWKEGRDTGAIANGVDTVMYRLFPIANNGARLTVTLNAKDGTGATVVMKQERLVSVPTAAGVPVLATVGADVALGAGAIITWDVATNNELSIKIKGNGTTLTAGYFILEIDGEINAMNYGYNYSA